MPFHALPNGGFHDEEEYARDLAIRVRGGDVDAYGKLIDIYIDGVTRFAYYIVGSLDTADDVAQSVFIWLWEHRENIDPHRSIRSYLLGATRNRALNERKSDVVRERYRSRIQADAEAGHISSEVPSSEDAFLSADAVQFALTQLSERRQLAIRLRIRDEMNYNEIAEVLRTTPDTARKLVTRALEDLRKILSKVSDS